MCYANEPIDLSRPECRVIGGQVYGYESFEVPCAHVGGAPTKHRRLSGIAIGYVDPRLPDRAWVNGQLRRRNQSDGVY